MSRENSTAQTIGNVDQAIANLDAIKSGEDPRATGSAIVVDELPQKDAVKVKRYRGRGVYERTREDVHDAFLELLNLVEPDHPYHDDPYPVKLSDLKTSYHREDSNVWASCGPRRNSMTPVSFSVDMSMFEDAQPGFFWMVLAHEVIHVSFGNHSESSGHRPKFWRGMADAVVDVIEHRNRLVGSSVDDQQFVPDLVQQSYYDVHSGNTDRRSMTVVEQRQAVLDRISSECRRRDLDVSVEIDR